MIIPTSQVPATDQAEFATWQRRGVPAPARVTDGAWVIPVPAPGLAIRYTLCYVVRSGESYLVIDPGMDSEEGWAALTAGFETFRVELRAVRGIVATHGHIDHVGLVDRLRGATGAWFALGEGEPLPIRDENLAEAGDADDALLRAWGVPRDLRDQLNVFRSDEALDVQVADPDFRLTHGQVTPDVPLTVIMTPGHTPGHICLKTQDESILFTGDHVLPRISPHSSIWIGGLEDPLRDYRTSLAVIGELRDTVLVCPGHEYRFMGIGIRTNELDEELQHRSDEVLATIAESGASDIWSIAPAIRWSRGWESLQGMTRRLALAECASHVQYLTRSERMPHAVRTRP